LSHWYSREGEPRHFVTGADGSSRPATLADARKNGWLPGFSGVDRVIHNHFLTEWLRNEAIKAARATPRMPDEAEKEFLSRVNAEASRKASEAREVGKAIHYAIEASFAGESVPEAYTAHVDAVRALLAYNFPSVGDWVSEQAFACRDGYGGTIDLYSPSANVLVDYKGADFGPDTPGKKLAYSQNRQLAAYRHGKGMPDARCVNVFVSRSHPGMVKFHEWTEADLQEGHALFRHALGIWKILNKYDGSWT